MNAVSECMSRVKYNIVIVSGKDGVAGPSLRSSVLQYPKII